MQHTSRQSPSPPWWPSSIAAHRRSSRPSAQLIGILRCQFRQHSRAARTQRGKAMTNTKQIEQAMIVRNNAAALLEDHENEPVDAWELAQETGLTEKQVSQSLKYLAGQDLIELENGKVTAVLPMFHNE